MVALESGPCACGRSLRRVVALDGRSEDILHLPSASGGRVAVHPITVRSPFAHVPGIRQYRVVFEPDGLRVLISLEGGVDGDDMVRRVGDAVSAALAGAGARPPRVAVEVVETLDRDSGHGAKFKLVDVRVDARRRSEP
jgi:phenylacetate-CoA ligase